MSKQVYSFTSERTGKTHFLGCLQPSPHPDFLNYEKDVRPKAVAAGLLPTLPPNWGHGHSLPQGAWRMLGNGPDDTVFPGFGGCGDCAEAGPAHEEMSMALNAGRPMPQFSGATIVRQYSEVKQQNTGEGYDPKTGKGDTGLAPEWVFKKRQTTGLKEDSGKALTIGQVIEMGPNIEHFWEGAYLFETLGVALMLQEAQQEQFEHQPQPTWDYVPGSPDIGGHYVPIVGKEGLLTWGEDCYYTPSFIEHQAMVGYCYMDISRYNAVTGQTAEHWHEQDLERFFHILAEVRGELAEPAPPQAPSAPVTDADYYR